MALQPRRAKTDWSGCCQMAVQGALSLAKRVSLNLNFSFLNRISLLLIQVATQLSSRGWVDLVPDPILPEKFLGYSRESNPGPLGWHSSIYQPFFMSRIYRGPLKIQKGFFLLFYLPSTAVEQVVACALVTQRDRVRSPVGTGFLGEVFRGFSSPVRQMIGNFRPPRSPNIIWPSRRDHHSIFALLGWLSVCLVCIVFHVCAVSVVVPSLSWSLIRGGPSGLCVVKKVCMWSIV